LAEPEDVRAVGDDNVGPHGGGAARAISHPARVELLRSVIHPRSSLGGRDEDGQEAYGLSAPELLVGRRRTASSSMPASKSPEPPTVLKGSSAYARNGVDNK